MNDIPAISFIRIGNSLIDENDYLVYEDIFNKNKKINDKDKDKDKDKKEEKQSYHKIVQKLYQDLKNRK